MTGDQYGTHVDEEIRIPIKYAGWDETGEWKPLGVNSWIEMVETYGTKDGSQKPLKTGKEWAIAHADGTVDHVRYEMETEAKWELEVIRSQLKMYRIPEEYWPVLMERTVETVASSWKILDV